MSKTATPLPSKIHLHALPGNKGRPKAFDQVRKHSAFKPFPESGKPIGYPHRTPVLVTIAEAEEILSREENAK